MFVYYGSIKRELKTEVTGVPSRLILIRQDASLTRVLSTLDLNCEENSGDDCVDVCLLCLFIMKR
jgi:hypothetical protein